MRVRSHKEWIQRALKPVTTAWQWRRTERADSADDDGHDDTGGQSLAGTILRLALSLDGTQMLSCADDRSVKLWDANELKQQRVFTKQRDWVSAAAFLSEDRIAVGRLDGSLDIYDLKTEQALGAPTLKAELK